MHSTHVVGASNLIRQASPMVDPHSQKADQSSKMHRAFEGTIAALR